MADRPLRSMEVKVGALILSAVLLLVAFLILLGDFSCRDRSPLMVDFPNSGDLKTGAPVKISGVTVGKVTAVELWGGRRDPERDNKPVQVRARLTIDSASFVMLRQDSRLHITTLGILGEKYVEIDPGTPEALPLKPGQVVDGVSPMRFELMGANANETIARVSALLQDNQQGIRDAIDGIGRLANQVDEVVGENRDDIRQIVGNLNRVSAALAIGTGDGGDLRGIVASLRSLSDTLDRGVRPVVARLPAIADNLDRTLTEGHGLVTDARAVVSDGRQGITGILGDVRTLSRNAVDGKGTIGALLADREIYDDLIAIMKDLKRHPWKLLLKD